MEKINDLLESLKRNLFTNDMNWRTKKERNEQLAHEIREAIANDPEIDNKVIVETLDFLEEHDL